MAAQSFFFPYLPDFDSLPTKSLSSSLQTIQNRLQGGDKEAAGAVSEVSNADSPDLDISTAKASLSDNEAEAYSVGSTSQVCAKFDCLI